MNIRELLKPDTATAEVDIDLTPMMSFMVCIIPIMLLSVVFVQIKVIETPLPQIVQNAIQEDQKNNKSILIKANVSNNRSVSVIVIENGRTTMNQTIATNGKAIDLKRLGEALTQVKQRYPQVFRLELNPDNKVSYEEVVKVMDEARNTKVTKFNVTDPTTNQKTETTVMFPNVVLSNVVEG